MESNVNAVHPEPWNKEMIVGQKAPFKVKDIWALRVCLQMESRVRELALFNLGINGKLHGCDLVSLEVRDICHGDQVASRAMVMKHQTQRPVQFEITPATRDALQKWIKMAGLKSDDFVFPSRIHNSLHLGTGSTRGSSKAGSRSSALAPQTMPAFDAAHQGDIDLTADEEPACRPVALGTFQIGIDRSLPRDRGGRRSQDFRADGDLTKAQGAKTATDTRLAGQCHALSAVNKHPAPPNPG